MANKSIPVYSYGGIGGKMVKPLGSGAVGVEEFKFNPGFYWAAQHGSGDGPYGALNWETIKTELNATDNCLRGVLIRVNWPDLETSEGVYNFTPIINAHNELAALSNGPAKLCVMVEYASSCTGPNTPPYCTPGDVTPSYITDKATNPQYEGGSWIAASTNTPGNNKRYIRLWNTAVIARLKLLSDAMAAALDNLPHFEMLQFSETTIATAQTTTYAPGNTLIPANYNSTNSAQAGSYGNGMLQWVTYTKGKFKKTNIAQLANYPKAFLTNYIPSLRTAGVSISCPNNMKDEPGLNDPMTPNGGILTWFRRTDTLKLKDYVGICPHIQKPECYYSNMSWDGYPNPSPPPSEITAHDGLGNKPGVSATPQYGTNGAKEIVDVAKAYGANYLFVTRAILDSGDGGSLNPNAIVNTDWLAFFSLAAQTGTIHGGLNATRPTRLTTL